MAVARTGTSAKTRAIARRALDRRAEQLRPIAQALVAPRGGWVRAVREALGMSAADLARRMGTSPTSVLSLERHEQSGSVRLDTLARAAQALDCDLIYALVPRKPLEDVVGARARERALERLRAVDHTMQLEGQGVSRAALQDQLDEQVSLLRDQPGLWRDE